MPFTVDVVTPERVVLSEPATALVAPGSRGSFGVWSHHAPFMSELTPGELRITVEAGPELKMAVTGGFVQIFENKVTILADAAEKAEEIDAGRAREALVRAQDELRAAQDAMTRLAAEEAAARARARLRVAGE
ncbi:MAG: F0F1 ATP synthase subunit epsilon [Armatimonadetes bacterium]|nr:F0F1 ATP synthase subunit epsilon [Armatimonadota bacterium]